MSERWKPRELHRMVTPEMRAAAQQRQREDNARRAALIDEHQRRARLSGGVAKLVLCSHGVQWTACTTCSKPRNPR